MTFQIFPNIIILKIFLTVKKIFLRYHFEDIFNSLFKTLFNIFYHKIYLNNRHIPIRYIHILYILI